MSRSSAFSWLGSRSRPSQRRPGAHPSRRANRRRLSLEALEPRTMLSAISIADTSAIEGSDNVAYLGNFVNAGSGGLLQPRHLAFNDGVMYAASGQPGSGEVLRFDAATGAFMDVAIPQSAGLLNPWAIAFGPDGKLYALGAESDNVVRYDPDTGLSTEFVSAAANGGLYGGQGLTFGQDGDLFVTSGDTTPDPDEVLRFDGVTGAFEGAFVPDDGFDDGSNTLENPNGLVFGPDGKLYVANTRGDSIFRYHADGTKVGTFVAAGSGGLDAPTELEFHDGKLYVAGQFSDAVHVYDATTGTFIESISGGGLDGTGGIAFDADGNLYVASQGTQEVLRFGAASQAAFTITLSAASETPVTVDYATAGGTADSGADFVAATGSVTFAPGETSRTILVQTLNDSVGEPSETFSVTLSNAVGATISDGVGVGTILDDETKFYVVNDATGNQTYEYGSDGAAGENYALNAGNAAPRGAAATSAGDKVWVVDANKNVYVYDPQGALLGSWTLNSLASNAQVEGIATNGTDVWIVDNKADRVYRYAGAAGRLTGSQGAATSFALNSGNKDAKDLVTDGTNIWVVNDTTTNKVFKYTLAGALVGSWTIASPNSTPTGITLDPTGASSDLWIVDSGTDKVYQYTAGKSRTSGSQSASATFNLAAGNTNPQGIADPPVAGKAVAVSQAAADSVAKDAAPVAAEAVVESIALRRSVRQAFDSAVVVERPSSSQDGQPAGRFRGQGSEAAAKRYDRAADETFSSVAVAELPKTTLAAGTRPSGERLAAHDAVFGAGSDFLLDALLPDLAG